MFCSVSFLSFLTILTIVEGKAPIFRTDAAFFKKVIQGGEVQMDVNSIEVTARPFSMVELDGDRVSIEIKTGSDDAIIFIMYHLARVVSFLLSIYQMIFEMPNSSLASLRRY